MGTDAQWQEARRLHARGDVRGGLAQAQAVLADDPDHVEALEHVATVLVTRMRRHTEGLAAADRLVALRPDDAGAWYARGWLYEFSAHESRRRQASALDPTALLETAAASFRRCLELQPGGKLQGDAEDLLDHVENALRQA